MEELYEITDEWQLTSAFLASMLWTILFFGGALLSPATGVCINAVHPELRSFSSAMSMFA